MGAGSVGGRASYLPMSKAKLSYRNFLCIESRFTHDSPKEIHPVQRWGSALAAARLATPSLLDFAHLTFRTKGEEP